jgi:hypothetical protein
MKAIELTSHWRGAAAVVSGTALLFTVGCGTAARDASSTIAAQQPLAPVAQQVAPAGAPVVVGCEPHQRTLVRQALVNGTMVSQVECVAAEPSALMQTQPLGTAGYVSSPRPTRVVQPVYSDLGDTRVIQSAPVRTVARPIRTRQVVYDDQVPVRRQRSVKKSAIIIGSSAGVGAGVGAAVGGKKGALIGAAIGGGSAAIWDQVTRRR